MLKTAMFDAQSTRIALPSLRTLDLPMPALECSPRSSSGSDSGYASDNECPWKSKTSSRRSLCPPTESSRTSRSRQATASPTTSRLSASPSPPPSSRRAARLAAPSPVRRSGSPSPFSVPSIAQSSQCTPAPALPFALTLPANAGAGAGARLRLVPAASLEGADAAVVVAPGARPVLLVGPANVARVRCPARPLAKGARVHPYRVLRVAPAAAAPADTVR